jgi:hypothetical protein
LRLKAEILVELNGYPSAEEIYGDRQQTLRRAILQVADYSK